MSSVVDMVDQAVNLAQESAANCRSYASQIQKPGLEHLALTVVEMQSDHAGSLKDLARRGNIESIFAVAESALGDAEIAAPHYDSAMSVFDFLQYVMRSLDCMIRMYVELEAAATDTEVAGLFRRLIGEAGRARSTVSSRHDLETLSSG